MALRWKCCIYKANLKARRQFEMITIGFRLQIIFWYTCVFAVLCVFVYLYRVLCLWVYECTLIHSLSSNLQEETVKPFRLVQINYPSSCSLYTINSLPSIFLRDKDRLAWSYHVQFTAHLLLYIVMIYAFNKPIRKIKLACLLFVAFWWVLGTLGVVIAIILP